MIAFDIIIQRYLPKYSLKLLNISDFEKTISARDYYLREAGDKYFWVLN